ncbi:SPOSA6832_00007, partial [Sporobolomyces salmonicolor]
MADPSASVTLPPTFSNSVCPSPLSLFWSSDYRTGFESLYNALNASCVQSDELLAHVRRRVDLERQLADGLLPPALRLDGFASDEGASLRIGFEALLTSSVGEAKARQALADDLMHSIYLPFSAWSTSHTGRIRSSRSTIESALQSWEKQKALVAKLREVYGESCRQADEIEDELEFVRGREALSAGTGDDAGKGREGVVLPPRPFEIDDKAMAQPRSRTSSARSTSTKDEDDQSEDGLSSIDHGDADDHSLLDRSGATGGSVVAALGRALTLRKQRDAPQSLSMSSAGSGADREEGATPDSPGQWNRVEKLMEDRNVKAAFDFSKTKFTSLLSRVAGPQTGEERHLRARKEADAAEEKYKNAVEVLDSLRLILEELLSTHLPYVQHCEADRLRAATSVLRSFHAAISALPRLVSASHERVGQALELVRGEKDLKGLIERRRTGPFQPHPIMFASHYSDPALTTFGIDLRKYDETNEERTERPVPRVLEVLLGEIDRRGEGIGEEERRKSWLYETPLSAQHHLRSLLNSPSVPLLPAAQLSELLEPYDLPVLCSVVKLWFLELEVPVVNWGAYEELRAVYPARTLRMLVHHLSPLLDFTPTSVSPSASPVTPTTPSSSRPDAPSIYLQKLALSLSRPLLRPKVETALTLDDRFPALVVAEVLKGGEGLMGEAEERTKPIDVRPSRTNLGLGNRESVDLGKASAVLLQQQHSRAVPLPRPVPPLPPAKDGESEKKTLKVDPGLAPRAASSKDQGQEGEAFAESPFPMGTTREMPPRTFPTPEQPSAAPPAPPAEEVDEAGSEGAAAILAPSSLATTTASAPAPAPAETPLAPSSSLKRSSVTPGSRLRGARAPRPPSQVMAAVAAFEGGHKEGEGAAEGGKRESWTRSRVALPLAPSSEEGVGEGVGTDTTDTTE